MEQAPPIVLEPEEQKADSDSLEGIVELPGAIFRLHRSGAKGCWMGRRREFRNSQEFAHLANKSEYTHVCRLCWPGGDEGEDSAGEASPALSGDWEALVVGCTLLPLILTRRASYFYSAGCALHCLAATLSGHGY